MISAEQIRAARGYLDWSQAALAKEAGVSLSTVRQIEKGIASRSLAEVHRALKNRGFEFHGKNALKRRSEETQTYEGEGACDDFYDDLLAAAQKWRGQMNVTYPTSQWLAYSLGVGNFTNLERLEELSKIVKVRCLLADAGNSTLAIPCFQFKAMAMPLMGPVGIVTCGDKHAVILDSRGDRNFTYLVITSIDDAQIEMKRFDQRWKEAIPFVIPA